MKTQPRQTVEPPLQPSDSALFVSGITPHTTANLTRQKKIAFWLSIASIAGFIIALSIGLTMGFGAFALLLPILSVTGLMCVYAMVFGVRTKSTLVIILGAIGLLSTLLILVLAQLFL